jgi:hypothetical protein
MKESQREFYYLGFFLSPIIAPLVLAFFLMSIVCCRAAVLPMEKKKKHPS